MLITRRLIASLAVCVVMAGASAFAYAFQHTQPGDKQVCNSQPTPGSCGSGQGTCQAATVTYEELPASTEFCDGAPRVKITVVMTCNGNPCTRNNTVCPTTADDFTFCCEGHCMKLDLGSGHSWGDMPGQDNGALCSSATISCNT